MDARADLRVVEIRERTAAARQSTPAFYRTAQKAEALWRYLTRRHKRRRPRRARPSRDTIIDRASIHDRPKTIESRGEVTLRQIANCGQYLRGLAQSILTVLKWSARLIVLLMLGCDWISAKVHCFQRSWNHVVFTLEQNATQNEELRASSKA